jgi:CheY-like chemotaxis protein
VNPPSPAPAHSAPAQTAAPRRVLIIEDNDDTRQMLHQALEMSGHVVREARDGASGLALAGEARPDVALIDIGLPDVDGYEVARRLRAAPGGRRMGLIALTGYGQAEDQQRAFDAGFDAHLTKPVAPERLKQVIAGLA